MFTDNYFLRCFWAVHWFPLLPCLVFVLVTCVERFFSNIWDLCPEERYYRKKLRPKASRLPAVGEWQIFIYRGNFSPWLDSVCKEGNRKQDFKWFVNHLIAFIYILQCPNYITRITVGFRQINWVRTCKTYS